MERLEILKQNIRKNLSDQNFELKCPFCGTIDHFHLLDVPMKLEDQRSVTEKHFLVSALLCGVCDNIQLFSRNATLPEDDLISNE